MVRVENSGTGGHQPRQCRHDDAKASQEHHDQPGSPCPSVKIPPVSEEGLPTVGAIAATPRETGAPTAQFDVEHMPFRACDLDVEASYLVEVLQLEDLGKRVAVTLPIA